MSNVYHQWPQAEEDSDDSEFYVPNYNTFKLPPNAPPSTSLPGADKPHTDAVLIDSDDAASSNYSYDTKLNDLSDVTDRSSVYEKKTWCDGDTVCLALLALALVVFLVVLALIIRL